MRFTLDRLLAAIKRFPPARRYWVAYSGGLDSHALLHALYSLRDSLPAEILCAVHVNHGLNPASAAWSRHCVTVCNDLGITCRVLEVDAHPRKGDSPEEAARTARYHAIASLMESTDGLLTAHHQDDQVETVLLQLLRGAGPKGLAAMPRQDPFAAGWRGRPLLDFSRAGILAYARSRQLRWIEDESNHDPRIERNFLRHEVVPLLRSHWPNLGLTLSRTAAHCGEAAELLEQLAAQDYELYVDSGRLDIALLKTLDPARQRNLLRHWIKKQGYPLPATAHLRRILTEMLPAAEDAVPVVEWSGAEIRRYRNQLYVMAPLPPHDNNRILEWDLMQALYPVKGSGALRAVSVTGRGLALSFCQQGRVTVRFRRGGERCRLAGRTHRSKLKKILQEQGIAPWQRERIPLIYLEEELAAVAGLFVCKQFQAGKDEPGVEIVWEPLSPQNQ